MPRIGGVESAGDAGRGQRNVEDLGAVASRRVTIGPQLDVQSELLRAFLEQRVVAEQRQPVANATAVRKLGESEAEIGADARG